MLSHAGVVSHTQTTGTVISDDIFSVPSYQALSNHRKTWWDLFPNHRHI